MDKKVEYRQRHFVVVEHDPVVALDLTGILMTEFPKAELTLFRSEEEAQKYLMAAMTPLCVLLSTRALSKEMEATLRRSVGIGCEVLIIGTVRQLDFPTVWVQPPFTSEMILSMLLPAPQDALA